MDPYLGEIRVMANTFVPQGWALCSGEVLPIVQNTALYSILSNTYGGDGVSTFGLPNLRNRVAIGWGHAPGLDNYQLGEYGGFLNETLTTAQMPSHTHTVKAADLNATETEISGTSYPAKGYSPSGPVPIRVKESYIDEDPNVSMAPSSVESVGGNQAHTNVQPCLALYYMICVDGVYPQRS